MKARVVITLLVIINLTCKGENRLTNTFSLGGKISVGYETMNCRVKERIQCWTKIGDKPGSNIYDMALYVEHDSIDRSRIVLNGSYERNDINGLLNLFTLGERTWDELLTLKTLPEDVAAIYSIPIYGKESYGNAFLVKTNCDDYIVCRISSTIPEDFSELRIGDNISVLIEWVDVANERSLESMLPDGWRFPTEEDFGHDERIIKHRRYMHESINMPFYHVGADFNGDCIVDHACWLVNGDNSRNSRIILLSNNNKEYSIYNLYTGNYPLSVNEYLGYCAPGIRSSRYEAKKLHIINHAFTTNMFESSSEIIYYDMDNGKFETWQESD